MPQLARLDAAGVSHHIIIDEIERIRGIERRALFEDVFDRESFLKNYGHPEFVNRKSEDVPHYYLNSYATGIV